MKEETPAEGALRSLAIWLSAGGYNSPTVDAKVFEEKIRWGVDNAIKEAMQDERRRSHDIMDAAVAEMSARLASQVDMELARAISLHLGLHMVVDPARLVQQHDLRGRLQEVSRRGDGYSTFYCDGQPLLTLADVEFTHHDGRIAATRKVLWRLGDGGVTKYLRDRMDTGL